MNQRLPVEPLDPRVFPVFNGEAYRRRHRICALVTQSSKIDFEREQEILREILLMGVAALPIMRELLSQVRPRAAEVLRKAIHALVPEEIGSALAAGFALDRKVFPLELAATLLARLSRSELDVEMVMGKLDRLAEQARTHVEKQLQRPLNSSELQERPLDVLDRICQFWRESGFRGNSEDYYDVSNSWLPDVIRRKRGLPITLSILFSAICNRLGLKADGVGMPWHFVVRIEIEAEQGTGYLFIDPYHDARPLDLDDCKRMVESSGQVFKPDEHLAATSRMDTIVRICNNLFAANDQARNPLENERVATVVVHMNPNEPVPRLIRADRRMRRGAFKEARTDLELVLEHHSNTYHAIAAQRLLKQLELEFAY